MTEPKPLSPEAALDLAQAFLEATKSSDIEAPLPFLTESSREGANFGPDNRTLDYTIHEVETETDAIIVNATLVMGHPEPSMEQPMPIVVVEEGGHLRVDLEKSAERLIGINPQELLESMSGALEGLMETVGDAMVSGFGATESPQEPSREVVETPLAVKECRDVTWPKIEDELRDQLDIDIRLEMDWTALPVGEEEPFLNRLDRDFLDQIGYLLREVGSRTDLSRVHTLRFEPIEDSRDRDLFTDGSTVIFRLNPLLDDGSYSFSDLEQALPSCMAGVLDVPWRSIWDETPNDDDFLRLRDLYRDHILSDERHRLEEILGTDIDVNIKWSDLDGSLDAVSYLPIGILKPAIGAIALLARDPDNLERLQQTLLRVVVRFVEPDAIRCRLADSTLFLDLCPKERSRGCLTSCDIARVLEESLAIELRRAHASLQSDAATWEHRLQSELGRPLPFDIDWRGFASHPEQGRNIFASHLLREHGINAFYYAISSALEESDMTREEIRSKVGTLRIDHTVDASLIGLTIDGSQLVLTLALHDGYEGYLTNQEIEERLPSLLARMNRMPEWTIVDEDDEEIDDDDEATNDGDEEADQEDLDEIQERIREFDEMIEGLTNGTLPALNAQVSTMLGATMSFTVDFSGCDHDVDKAMALMTALGNMTSALMTVALDENVKPLLSARIQRIHLAMHADEGALRGHLEDQVWTVEVGSEDDAPVEADGLTELLLRTLAA